LSYDVELDKSWWVHLFRVAAIDGRTLACVSLGPGKWRDERGKQLGHLAGCIDIDLSFSPFTNSLPVHRINFSTAETREFSMLWVPTETLNPIPDGQRYTCIKPGRCFRYEATDGSFKAEIEFDEFGLVQDYPGLFRRIL
jgi:hypothetical protein